MRSQEDCVIRLLVKTHAIYPGSFDPLTNGHINLVERATAIFESVTVAVAINTSKKTIFSVEERFEMIQQVFESHPLVKVEKFEGLLVDYVSKKEDAVVMRGIRTNTDFEYELNVAHANRHLRKDFESVFMMTETQYSFLSSSMIKEIVSLGGSTEGMLPEFIEKRLRARLRERV